MHLCAPRRFAIVQTWEQKFGFSAVKMSPLYYEPGEPSAYAVRMKNKVFVVQRGVNRWGKRIDCSVSPFVKVSSQDTGGAWSMFEGAIAPAFGPPLHNSLFQIRQRQTSGLSTSLTASHP